MREFGREERTNKKWDCERNVDKRGSNTPTLPSRVLLMERWNKDL